MIARKGGKRSQRGNSTKTRLSVFSCGEYTRVFGGETGARDDQMIRMHSRSFMWALVPPYSLVPRRFLAAITNTDHGSTTSATERARLPSLSIEQSLRRPRLRERDIRSHSSQGCLWLSQHPSQNNQSKFSFGQCWSAAA